MKKIWLNGKHGSIIGNYAIVDGKTYDKLNKHIWNCLISKYINSTKYYASTRINGKCVLMHRLIMNITDSKIQIDHVNENGLDNQMQNLRIANKSQNAANVSKRKQHIATSQYKGVCQRENSWTAYITKNYKIHYLGQYREEIEAAKAYDIAAIKEFGEFASLNFPNNDYSNIKPRRLQKQTNTGYPNISWYPKDKLYKIGKMINGKRYFKYAKTLEEAKQKLEELNTL